MTFLIEEGPLFVLTPSHLPPFEFPTSLPTSLTRLLKKDSDVFGSSHGPHVRGGHTLPVASKVLAPSGGQATKGGSMDEKSKA